MRSFKLIITDTHKVTHTEIGSTEDNYDFYVEALMVAASVTSMSFVDDNRLALAKGEEVHYEQLNADRYITIKEED